MSKIFLIFLFFITSYSNFAGASPIMVRVALSEDYKPLSYGAGENVEGFVRELVELLFAGNKKFRLEFYGYPWARAQEEVRIGNADVLVTVASKERLEYMNASTRSMFTNSFYLYTYRGHKKSNELLSATGPAKLASFTACEYTGAGWGRDHLVPFVKEVQYANRIDQKIEMLATMSRCDLIVDGELVVDFYAKEKFEHVLLKAKTPFEKTEIKFLVRKNFAHPEVLTFVDKQFVKLSDSGKIKILKKKWFGR